MVIGFCLILERFIGGNSGMFHPQNSFMAEIVSLFCVMCSMAELIAD
jgi:hypothetical protein